MLTLKQLSARGMMLALGALLLPCLPAQANKADAWTKIKAAGKLVIAVDATYPPMESEGKDGKPEGFDIDFATELAQRLGLKPDFQVVSWDGIVAGLKSERYDVIISSMNITDERQKQVDFVEYARMAQLFIGKKGVQVSTDKDLEGKVVAVQVDTTSMAYVEKKKAEGIKIKDMKAFPNATQVFDAVKAGHAEVIVVDEPVGRFYAKNNPELFVVTGRAVAPEPLGIAMRKENPALREAITKAVEAMKKDGFVKKLGEKWFGGELGA